MADIVTIYVLNDYLTRVTTAAATTTTAAVTTTTAAVTTTHQFG